MEKFIDERKNSPDSPIEFVPNIDTNRDKGCNNYGLEVVDADLTMVGKRFCSITRNGYSFLSKTNVIGFYVYSIPGLGFFGNATFAVEGTPVVPITTTTLAPTTQTKTTTTIEPLPLPGNPSQQPLQ
ncbi:hypothetical protein PRIPAC_84600 [Pristionchus pacificus]|uniref:Uncharacterized protein n=1 Tax=Pristionchus pacificus TaxID=54126 RepID=A0A2A6BUB9_PRIPA|nr:hypothetical protein PRIPAC_84600 [Pristionchus pacificus]|eukprot:PDM69572.1 hypothetical protein PRIPAC_44668 [Pristionchus pacificus]